MDANALSRNCYVQFNHNSRVPLVSVMQLFAHSYPLLVQPSIALTALN